MSTNGKAYSHIDLLPSIYQRFNIITIHLHIKYLRCVLPVADAECVSSNVLYIYKFLPNASCFHNHPEPLH